MKIRDLAPLWTASLLALAPACDTTCDRYCSAQLACTPANVCVPVDLDATKSACVDACNAGLDNSGFDDCISCAAKVAEDGCRSPIKCSACADQDAYEVSGPAFAEGFYSKAREEDFLCTNGRNFWSNGCGWSTLDWEAQHCDLSCYTGWSWRDEDLEKKPPTVAAECAGPPEGPISCTCTAGKNTGVTFELDDCEDLIWDERLWNPCNL